MVRFAWLFQCKGDRMAVKTGTATGPRESFKEEGLDWRLPKSYGAGTRLSAQESLAEADLCFRVNRTDIGASLRRLSSGLSARTSTRYGGRINRVKKNRNQAGFRKPS